MELTLQQPQVAQAGDLRAFQGGHFRLLVAPAQTDNALALVEFTLPQGAEPPRHIHTREDEVFYVLEGEVTFTIGDEVLHAKAGDAAFGPRQVPHQFQITTPQARMLTLITPGSFLDYFLTFSTPLAAVRPVTPPQGPPPAEAILAMTRLLREQYGVLFT